MDSGWRGGKLGTRLHFAYSCNIDSYPMILMLLHQKGKKKRERRDTTSPLSSYR